MVKRLKVAPNSKEFKILYLSNSPTVPSGYGVQCAGNCYDWLKYYDVRVLANYGIQANMMGLNGLTIYAPLNDDPHGNRSADLIFKHWKPDLFVTLYDIWMGAYVREAGMPTLAPIHPFWVPIIMVDHEPVPESTVLSARASYKCVSPTKWGTDQLHRYGVPQAEHIPFGIDTKLWRPLESKEEQRQIKNTLGKNTMAFSLQKHLPINEDSFLIHINGANKDPYRKAFMRMFTALQIFLEQNPDAKSDVRVYVHSWMRMARDIPHGAKVLHVEEYCSGAADYHMMQGVPMERMAEIARSADVFFHLSEGGGFEVPLLEAMASGVPPIYLDFVANKELCDGRGWDIPVIKSKTGAIAKYFTPLDATQGIADEFLAAEALAEVYNSPGKRADLGEKGRNFSLDYDWSKVNPMWIDFIEKMRDETSYKPLTERRL